MKIKFNSDDDLPLKKQLKFFNLTIISRTVFEEEGKYYPQIFLDKCLCCSMKELMYLKELNLTCQINQRGVGFATIGILKALVINMNHMFVMDIMIY